MGRNSLPLIKTRTLMRRETVLNPTLGLFGTASATKRTLMGSTCGEKKALSLPLEMFGTIGKAMIMESSTSP